MGLVNYPSSSDSDSPPPPKKLKPSPPPTPSQSALPPLPPTFHDLYAHTVRPSTRDDPSLHQGRRRQIPHVAGQWPSHLYIEWRPSSPEHQLLESFLTRLRARVGEEVEMTGFLTSDVGVPLPLHVSLSRPIVLGTEDKEEFLPEVRGCVERARFRKFRLRVRGIEWHRTGESGRSFLVLRVWSRGCARGEGDGDGENGEKIEEGADGDGDYQNPNPELTVLLARCNTVVQKYGQPQLYEWADDSRIGDAFHISIAWSFAAPNQELRRKTAEVFNDPELKEAMERIEIPVDGIKAKIGNVVHHLPLSGPRKRTRT